MKGYPINAIKRWKKEATEIANRKDDEIRVKKSYRNIARTKMDKDIRKLLRPAGVEVVTRRNNTLFNTIRNDKDKRMKLDTPGVYKIPLRRGEERTAYVGRMQKSIVVRLEQHKDNIKNGNGATSLASAALFEKWEPKWNEVEVLTRPRTLMRSIIAEYIEIRNRRGELVNSVEQSERLEVWRRATGKYE